MEHRARNTRYAKRNGQMMVELIVALSILVIGFLGVIELLAKSIAANRDIADQYTASYLAGEGVEIVKNLIDANIAQGKGWNCSLNVAGIFQVNYDSLPPGASCPGNALKVAGGSPDVLRYNATTHLYKSGTASDGDLSPFTRKIAIVPLSDAIYVSSSVTYGSKVVSVQDIFTNWRP